MVNSYPDINNIEQIVKEILDINVLGGFSRSYSLAENGEMEPDRYIERLGDYVTEHALTTALEQVFSHTHQCAGLDGVIIAQSENEIIISYADGTQATFKRSEGTTS